MWLLQKAQKEVESYVTPSPHPPRKKFHMNYSKNVRVVVEQDSNLI